MIANYLGDLLMIAVYDFKPTYINFIILISVSPSFSFQSSINNERGAPLKRNRLFHSNYQYTEIGLAKITYSWWVCVRVFTINRYVYSMRGGARRGVDGGRGDSWRWENGGGAFHTKVQSDDGWNLVQYRKRWDGGRGSGYTKPDIYQSRDQRSKEQLQSTTIYITNFAEEMNAKHLFNSLRSYGDLQEVVIPARRNRMGKRFGFARFCRIQEPERFAMKLDNIFIGGDKLFANLPRYQRDQAKKMPGGPISKESEPVVRKSTQVWKPKVIGQACKITNGSMHDQMGGELKYEAKVEDMKRLSKAMVGVVIHPGQSYLIQEHFAMQGVSTILVTPLGANMVLLEGSVDDEDFQGYIEEAKGWLQQWFKEIKPWNASIVDEERLVWVRCYGVPSHVWDSDFFSFLTKDIGVFVNSDDNTMKRKTMDVARLMVRTVKKEAIHMIRKVCINGVSFSIKMVEDWFGPIQWSSLQDQSKRELYNDENSSSDDEVWPESSPEDDLVEEDDEAGSYGNNSALNEALIGISISNSNEGNNELVSKSGNQELGEDYVEEIKDHSKDNLLCWNSAGDFMKQLESQQVGEYSANSHVSATRGSGGCKEGFVKKAQEIH